MLYDVEREVFAGSCIQPEKMKEYGFQTEEDRLVYVRELPCERMKIIVEYDSEMHGKIIDTTTNEEYVNYRLEGATGFSAEIRQKYEELLIDIRTRCCENSRFYFQQARRISAYIKSRYGVDPEFLWAKYPSFGVYREQESQKWFALIGRVSKCKVDHGTDSEEETEFVNVRLKTDSSNPGHNVRGIYEAYHMNKKSWVSIILDDTLPDSEIQAFIEDSYQSLTEVRRRRHR